MSPQNTVILSLLRERPRTTGEFYKQYGIGRAASRIDELRKAGYVITTELIDVPTRRGDHARVARYALIKEPALPGIDNAKAAA